MKRILTILLLMANQAFATGDNTLEIKTDIEKVTVFIKGAQVTRSGMLEIESGRNTLQLKNLSPYIENRSIQVKGAGDFTILSVTHSYNYLDELRSDKKVDSLIALSNLIESKVNLHKNRLTVLSEKLSLLNVNKKIGNERSEGTIDDLARAVDFYDKTLMQIKSEELDLNSKVDQLTTELSRIQNQINELQSNTGQPSGEINIEVEANRKTNAALTVTYLVANAGWFPKYDLRVKDVESPLKLIYKAEVYQNTGIDWENITLKFSNGNPNQSGVAPKLNTWYLNYQKNTRYQRNMQGITSAINSNIRTVSGTVIDEQEGPLPGVNVMVKGSTVGTVTDVDGQYAISLPAGASELIFSYIGYGTNELPISGSIMDVELTPDVTQLNEIVVTGYGSSGRNRFASLGPNNYRKTQEAKTTVITTTVENQTTVEFEVEKPYTVKSKGKNLTVSLNDYEIETLYEYYAVPKLEKDAFLIARIINWDQFNLLEGEANLYFEDAYVGRSVLDAGALSDTLDISLGRDKNILIGRDKIDTYAKDNFLGANKVETRGFRISARNKKSQSIRLTIFDQIPVAAISPIEISVKELSNGMLNENTGEITWEMNLSPNSQSELEFQYEVKYPKRERVILE
jgi:hypothetical protein